MRIASTSIVQTGTPPMTRRRTLAGLPPASNSFNVERKRSAPGYLGVAKRTGSWLNQKNAPRLYHLPPSSGVPQSAGQNPSHALNILNHSSVSAPPHRRMASMSNRRRKRLCHPSYRLNAHHTALIDRDALQAILHNAQCRPCNAAAIKTACSYCFKVA